MPDIFVLYRIIKYITKQRNSFSVTENLPLTAWIAASTKNVQACFICVEMVSLYCLPCERALVPQHKHICFFVKDTQFAMLDIVTKIIFPNMEYWYCTTCYTLCGRSDFGKRKMMLSLCWIDLHETKTHPHQMVIQAWFLSMGCTVISLI